MRNETTNIQANLNRKEDKMNGQTQLEDCADLQQQSLEERPREIEADIVVAAHGNRDWAVVSLSGEIRGEGCPMVIYDSLESREAAEAARHTVLAHAIDGAHVFGLPEVPRTHFNTLGRIVAELRSARIEGDLHSLANRIVRAASTKPHNLDDGLPF